MKLPIVFFAATAAACLTGLLHGSVKLADVLERVKARVEAWWYDDDEVML